MTILGSPVPNVTQYFDNNGDPVSNGTVTVTVANSATLKTVYSDAALTTPITNPVQLDSAGMAVMFYGTGAVDVVVKDSNTVAVPGAQVLSAENVAKTQLEILGNTNASGARSVTTGYSVLSTDYLVTVNSSGTNPTVINLPAATQGHQVTIQNVGTNPVSITPHGSDSINALSASTVYTMPAAVAASQIYPTSLLYPDGTSNWRTLPAFPPVTAVTALTSGIKIAGGSGTLDGASPTPVATGLTTIIGASANILGGGNLGLGTSVLEVNFSGGTLNILPQKPTGAGDTTLVSSSGTETFTWMAIGT